MNLRRAFTVIDAHGGGQPLRIVTSGVPNLRGSSYRTQREHLRREHDDIRRLLLLEPRGHHDMYGAVLLPPTVEEADYGVVFMTNEGYSTMCGHGIIALTTVLIDTGTVRVQEGDTRITFETPAGLINARATVVDGCTREVRFRNVPAFRLVHGLEITVAEQPLKVDVVFGGAWYALVELADLGLGWGKTPVRDLANLGMAIKAAASNALDIVHPTDADLAGLYGTIFIDRTRGDDLLVRSTTIYANGAVDRSPCGTGTSALVAQLVADGAMGVGDTLTNESLIGSIFTGRMVVDTSVGQYEGVTTEIAGRGAITGFNQLVVDADDVLAPGFHLK